MEPNEHDNKAPIGGVNVMHVSAPVDELAKQNWFELYPYNLYLEDTGNRITCKMRVTDVMVGNEELLSMHLLADDMRALAGALLRKADEIDGGAA